jgi:CRISPR-associated endonuclease/helicase Cas3
VRLRCEELSSEQLAAECASRAEQGQVVLWIRNTVAEAQRSFAAIKGAICSGGPETALLHSRFPWFRRDALEEEWLVRLGKDGASRPRGCVVVATQVVEQSVDIDADFLVTDLAPTDMLLQRLGRLWRHQRLERPNLKTGPEAWIHAPDCAQLDKPAGIKATLKGLAPPYDAYVLLRSRKEWAGRKTIRLPSDIREILEATYSPWADEPAAWIRLREQLEKRKAKFVGKALGATNRWSLPALNDDEGVQTRLNELPTITLGLLRSLEGGRGEVRFVPLDGEAVTASEREWAREAAVALHRNHVKVPAWWLRDRERNNPAALNRYFLGQWAWARGMARTSG